MSYGWRHTSTVRRRSIVSVDRRKSQATLRSSGFHASCPPSNVSSIKISSSRMAAPLSHGAHQPTNQPTLDRICCTDSAATELTLTARRRQVVHTRVLVTCSNAALSAPSIRSTHCNTPGIHRTLYTTPLDNPHSCKSSTSLGGCPRLQSKRVEYLS